MRQRRAAVRAHVGVTTVVLYHLRATPRRTPALRHRPWRIGSAWLAQEAEANRLASRVFFFQKGIGLSAPQLDPVGPTHHGAESGGVVVRVHLARADGY